MGTQFWPGDAYPLGARFDGAGTNFAIFSEAAELVELCLFDGPGPDAEETRLALPEVDAFVWHGHLPGIVPGQRYGYRVHGPFDPGRGLRCNPSKLLLDPYAQAIEGEMDWDEACFGYDFGDPWSRNDGDSAPHTMRSVVVNPYFDWDVDRPPRKPYHETVIYEAHVRGLTINHPGIPEAQRGTYAGLGHPVMIDYLRDLGVTAVELMPVHQFVHDDHLLKRGLRNYWGYNTIGFFAPHNAYSATGQAGQQVLEFKAMVKALHEAGIEVILDVVYNHTAEGNHMGPTLSFRGIDNAAYYRLVDDDQRYYMDTTGTGNSLLMRSPHVLQMIMDSLRYWVTDMHVDGFRFDLAATLARELHEVDRLSAFFDLVQQDPVVSQVKLIAEPWDVGEGGYQVGNFPPLWTEWNGKYRDTVRDFWAGRPGTMPDFASRITGSSDLYASDGRRPLASINFVTCHDGFTLHDLVSYNHKHNEANGEDNRDGTDDNRSFNCGIEGPTDDLNVIALRERQKRNFFATLFLSQGVPMISHGDEAGRTQDGNNNGYCQDNELSWMDWSAARDNWPLLEFVRRLARLRADHPVFRRRRFFRGAPVRVGTTGDGQESVVDPVHGAMEPSVRTAAGGRPGEAGTGTGASTGTGDAGAPAGTAAGTEAGTAVAPAEPVPETALSDITWFTPGGREMADADWAVGFAKSLQVFLNGEAISEPGRRGEKITDDSFLLLINAHDGDLPFALPPSHYGTVWSRVLDTANVLVTEEDDELPSVKAGESIVVEAHSVQVLRRV